MCYNHFRGLLDHRLTPAGLQVWNGRNMKLACFKQTEILCSFQVKPIPAFVIAEVLIQRCSLPLTLAFITLAGGLDWCVSGVDRFLLEAPHLDGIEE